MSTEPEAGLTLADGVPEFRPAYLLALRTWLALAGLVIAAIWIEASMTLTLTDYLRVAGPIFGPVFLLTALTVYFKPSLADRCAIVGFVALSLYFALAYVFAIIVGPQEYSFLIFANAIWISALYLYSSLFLGRYALRANVANATAMTVLTIPCVLRLFEIDQQGQTRTNFAVQPYLYALLAQWAMIPGALAINHLYKAMRDSQRKVAMLRQVVAEMVGHEVGTPLQAIVNHIELLQLLQARAVKETGRNGNVEKSQRVIENLRRSVQQVQNVLDNAGEALRADGRAASGKAAADHVCLVELIEDTVAEFQGRAAERGLVLTFSRSDPVPSDVTVDKTRLTQIINNLISNAIKYSDMGEIVVQAVSMGRGHLQILVSDSGIGIPQDSLDKIWEPYVRLPEAQRRGVRGSGLGLAVVKREVAILGGHIELQSVHGRGSQFTCDIPASIRSFAPRGLDNGSGPQVLIIDDSNVLLSTASQMFEAVNIDCCVAEDGQQALDLLRGQCFDIVFLDIQLPGMDGFEVARRLRGDPDLMLNRHTPIIAMSAEEPSASLRDEHYFNFFLKKPFAFTDRLLSKHLVQANWAIPDDHDHPVRKAL